MRSPGHRFRRAASVSIVLGALCIVSLQAPLAAAPNDYPPPISPSTGILKLPDQDATTGLIFTNTHAYAYGGDPLAVVIKVDVYDNYLGDFTKYHWVYTVTNNSYEPNPGSSNGFSGFETAMPADVLDLGDVAAPNGIPPWAVNCCSGVPLEWDLPNTAGAPVGGGTRPGETEVYSFTSAPRLVTVSTGWFHTWEADVQAAIVSFPEGEGPEVPDVLTEPNQELCCHPGEGGGGFVCEVLPAGQCTSIGGIIVVNCESCPPATPAKKSSWGAIKRTYR
jgi:hypothetical protein